MARVENFLSIDPVGTNKIDDKEEIGIGGFTAFVAVNQTRTLTSSSPNVFLEDGSAIQDTIFLAPIQLSIEGEIADVHIKKETTPDLFRQIDSAIGVVTPYLPTRTQSQISLIREIKDDAINVVRKIDDVVDDGQQLFSIFANSGVTQPNQKLFLDYLDRIHFTKVLISIESPFRVYENMRIESFETSKDNQNDIIRFKINAKEIRVAEVLLRQIPNSPAKAASSGVNGQTQGETDKGVTNGEQPPQSILSSFGTAFGFGG